MRVPDTGDPLVDSLMELYRQRGAAAVAEVFRDWAALMAEHGAAAEVVEAARATADRTEAIDAAYGEQA